MICRSLGLSGEGAEALIDFLYQLTEALERHYGGLLINRAHHRSEPSCPPKPASTPSDYTPF